MELCLWRLLAVVAAVLIAAGHLAATRGMGAIVLIGLCVRHMTAFKRYPTRREPLVSITGSALGCRRLAHKEFHPICPPSHLESFNGTFDRIGDSVDRAISGPECDYGCGVAYGVTWITPENLARPPGEGALVVVS